MSDIRIVAHIDEALRDKEAAVERALTAVGEGLVSAAHDEIQADPRRVDTGTLMGSIDKEVEENVVQVGTAIPYSIYVHEGTSRMEANRFIRNAFMNNLDNIRNMLEMYLKGG